MCETGGVRRVSNEHPRSTTPGIQRVNRAGTWGRHAGTWGGGGAWVGAGQKGSGLVWWTSAQGAAKVSRGQRPAHSPGSVGIVGNVFTCNGSGVGVGAVVRDGTRLAVPGFYMPR